MLPRDTDGRAAHAFSMKIKLADVGTYFVDLCKIGRSHAHSQSAPRQQAFSRDATQIALSPNAKRAASEAVKVLNPDAAETKRGSAGVRL